MSTRRIRGWHVDSRQQSSTASSEWTSRWSRHKNEYDRERRESWHLPAEDSERGTTHVDLLVAAEGPLSNWPDGRTIRLWIAVRCCSAYFSRRQ